MYVFFMWKIFEQRKKAIYCDFRIVFKKSLRNSRKVSPHLPAYVDGWIDAYLQVCENVFWRFLFYFSACLL